jgi:hypothetical protein
MFPLFRLGQIVATCTLLMIELIGTTMRIKSRV